MVRLKTFAIAVAAVAALAPQAARAADLPPLMPPPAIQEYGGWYLRGDIGMTNQLVGNLNNVLFPGTPDLVIHDKNFEAGMLFGVGIGYKHNSWFRWDITGEYRGKGLFVAQDRYTDGNVFIATNDYQADIESWVGLFNTYIDLGTWHCVTPYVGGGIGFASISVLGYTDVNVNVPGGSVAYGKDHTETNFAWALYGGLAYEVTPGFTIDLAYRYTDLGDAKTGKTFTYDNAVTAGSFEIEDITSHDVMLSVRWALGKQPAPMPVAFK